MTVALHRCERCDEEKPSICFPYTDAGEVSATCHDCVQEKKKESAAAGKKPPKRPPSYTYTPEW